MPGQRMELNVDTTDAEYMPKTARFPDNRPGQDMFGSPFTRRLLCLLSYTGEGLGAW